MTIQEFAEAAGARKNTVIDWQNDVSSPPTAKLAALAAMGLDVLYVVTGQRAGGAPAAPALTREEEALLDNYRHSPPDAQRAIKAASDAFAKYEGCCVTKKAG